jgi:radical SAM protein with 4Fe4S-binding SPASM domain
MYRITDVNYMITLFCPGKCKNCNLWKFRREEITEGEIEVHLFRRAIDSKVLKDAFYFDLTGGESQLSEKYVETVRVIAEKFPDAFIHTNVSGWYPELHYRRTLESLKFISPKRFRVDVSLDGRPENYNKIRLVPNGWERAVKTVELLKELGVIIRLTMIIYRENYRDIEWFVEFANQLGVGYYLGYARASLNYLHSPSKRGYFSPEEIDYIEKALDKVGWLKGKRIKTWLWAKGVYTGKPPSYECFMGREAITIDPYGNVYPCNELLPQLKMGNLRDFNGNLDLLLGSDAAKNVLKFIEEKRCQPCSVFCAHKVKFAGDI